MAPSSTNDWQAHKLNSHDSSQSAWRFQMPQGNPSMGHAISNADNDTTPLPMSLSSQAMTPTDTPNQHAISKRKREEDLTLLVARKGREMTGNASEDEQERQWRDMGLLRPNTPSTFPRNHQANISSFSTKSSCGLDSASASPSHQSWPQGSPQLPPSACPQVSSQIPRYPMPQISTHNPQHPQPQVSVQVSTPAYLPLRQTAPTAVDLELLALIQATSAHKPSGIKLPSSKEINDFKDSVNALDAMPRPSFLPRDIQGVPPGQGGTQAVGALVVQQMGPPQMHGSQLNHHSGPEVRRHGFQGMDSTS